MLLKWKSFPYKSFKHKWRSQYAVQKHIHWTFMYLGHALSLTINTYSLLLNVCDLYAAEICLSERRDKGRSCVGFFYCEYSSM